MALVRKRPSLTNIVFRDSATDATQLDFINDFCPIDAETTTVYKNSIGHTMEFSLQSFAFSADVDAEIFLHCTVSQESGIT